jgi:hypothetical protein
LLKVVELDRIDEENMTTIISNPEENIDAFEFS